MISAQHTENIIMQHGQSWTDFWCYIQQQLKKKEYKTGTLLLYRQVLRNLSSYAAASPCNISRNTIRAYILSLTRQNVSSTWAAMNISVLRTCFDKFCRTDFLSHHRSPRRSLKLPDILSPDEITQILSAADSPRDALLLSLLYGCGLKPGEAVKLQWQDFRLDENTLVIPGQRPRKLIIPEGICQLIQHGQKHCPPEHYIFPGRKKRNPSDRADNEPHPAQHRKPNSH